MSDEKADAATEKLTAEEVSKLTGFFRRMREAMAEEDNDTPITHKPIVEPVTSTRSFWARIERPFMFGLLLTLGGLVAFALGATVVQLSTAIMYVVIALFLALGIDPGVRLLERLRLPRPAAVITVILGLLAILGLVLWAVIPTVVEQIAAFAVSIPDAINDFTRSELYARLEVQFGENFEDAIAEIQKFLSDPANILAIGGGVAAVGTSIVNGVTGFIMIVVLTLYFVATLPTIKSALLSLAPARSRANARIITDQVTNAVGNYVQGMATLAFFNAVVVVILYAALSLPFPLLMAVTAFLITMIPMIGSLLFLAIGSGIALFSDPLLALIFAIVYFIYIQIEAYLVGPRVMNRAVSVPGSLVVIGALVGATLYGMLGALLAVPVTASILIIIKQVWIPHQDARV